MKGRSQPFLILTLAGLFVMGLWSSVSAQKLERLSAEFQFTPTLPGPELLTLTTPLPARCRGKDRLHEDGVRTA